MHLNLINEGGVQNCSRSSSSILFDLFKIEFPFDKDQDLIIYSD